MRIVNSFSHTFVILRAASSTSVKIERLSVYTVACANASRSASVS
ncbi:hypothetical protein NKDENANG_00762 [Candidatus Entotheonellaceae bacterium PAL068K]